jgi:hypothetical protein
MSSTLLDEPAARRRSAPRAPNQTPMHSPSQQLRATMAAVRVMFTWFGTRKTLTPEQKEQAAESFGAEGTFLSAGKKLLDTRHEAFKAVTALRGRMIAYWRGISLPYPEPGIRLVRQGDIQAFTVQMTSLRAELEEAVAALDEHYGELREAARLRLGQLFNAGDYPTSLRGLFGVAWDFPSVEPPDYLRQLSPQLYEEESRRVAARFDEAVRLAEEAFATELVRLVDHLAERLSGQEDGRPKIFRDSAVENLTEFFQRFRALNVRSNQELDDLVARAQHAISGVEPQSLRTSQVLRQDVTDGLTQVGAQLDLWLVDRPRRNILRRNA